MDNSSLGPRSLPPPMPTVTAQITAPQPVVPEVTLLCDGEESVYWPRPGFAPTLSAATSAPPLDSATQQLVAVNTLPRQTLTHFLHQQPSDDILHNDEVTGPDLNKGTQQTQPPSKHVHSPVYLQKQTSLPLQQQVLSGQHIRRNNSYVLSGILAPSTKNENAPDKQKNYRGNYAQMCKEVMSPEAEKTSYNPSLYRSVVDEEVHTPLGTKTGKTIVPRSVQFYDRSPIDVYGIMANNINPDKENVSPESVVSEEHGRTDTLQRRDSAKAKTMHDSNLFSPQSQAGSPDPFLCKIIDEKDKQIIELHKVLNCVVSRQDTKELKHSTNNNSDIENVNNNTQASSLQRIATTQTSFYENTPAVVSIGVNTDFTWSDLMSSVNNYLCSKGNFVQGSKCATAFTNTISNHHSNVLIKKSSISSSVMIQSSEREIIRAQDRDVNKMIHNTVDKNVVNCNEGKEEENTVHACHNTALQRQGCVANGCRCQAASTTEGTAGTCRAAGRCCDGRCTDVCYRASGCHEECAGGHREVSLMLREVVVSTVHRNTNPHNNAQQMNYNNYLQVLGSSEGAPHAEQTKRHEHAGVPEHKGEQRDRGEHRGHEVREEHREHDHASPALIIHPAVSTACNNARQHRGIITVRDSSDTVGGGGGDTEDLAGYGGQKESAGTPRPQYTYLGHRKRPPHYQEHITEHRGTAHLKTAHIMECGTTAHDIRTHDQHHEDGVKGCDNRPHHQDIDHVRYETQRQHQDVDVLSPEYWTEHQDDNAEGGTGVTMYHNLVGNIQDILQRSSGQQQQQHVNQQQHRPHQQEQQDLRIRSFQTTMKRSEPHGGEDGGAGLADITRQLQHFGLSFLEPRVVAAQHYRHRQREQQQHKDNYYQNAQTQQQNNYHHPQQNHKKRQLQENERHLQHQQEQRQRSAVSDVAPGGVLGTVDFSVATLEFLHNNGLPPL